MLLLGNTQLTKFDVDGVHGQLMPGGVRPHVIGGPVPDRPHAIVPSAREMMPSMRPAGVEMPTGGGFIGPHTPQLAGPSSV